MGQNQLIENYKDLQCTITNIQVNLNTNNEIFQQIKLKHDGLQGTKEKDEKEISLLKNEMQVLKIKQESNLCE